VIGAMAMRGYAGKRAGGLVGQQYVDQKFL
jgi:hypothetical protein